jgi:hypothetical protein
LTTKAKAKTSKVKEADEMRSCNFCKRDDRMSLVRLIIGDESRLVWVCPDHRG